MPRIVLRPLTAADRPRVREILTDPQVSPWWSDPEEDADDFVLQEDDHRGYAIEHEGRTVGVIQAWEELDPQYRHAGIDIAVHPEHHGHGYGAEAIRVLARQLFDEGHHRVTIDPAVANVRAIHVYEKVGFRRVGVLRQYERGPDGTWQDVLLLDLLNGEIR